MYASTISDLAWLIGAAAAVLWAMFGLIYGRRLRRIETKVGAVEMVAHGNRATARAAATTAAAAARTAAALSTAPTMVVRVEQIERDLGWIAQALNAFADQLGTHLPARPSTTLAPPPESPQ